MAMGSWQLVKGGVTLRDQVNARWATRDKASDGSVGNADHADRESDHNPDANGWVHAIDIDEDLRGSKHDNVWLGDQLIAYARMRRGGSNRFKNIVYEDRVASGTYPETFWTWRGSDYGHEHHLHVSFTAAAEQGGQHYDIPILDGQAGLWDGSVPYFDVLLRSLENGERNKATWRLACRLAELGFYKGEVTPEGAQGFPVKAIESMQNWMGWAVQPYCEKTHKAVWKSLENTPS
jgi:hypothetical protein